MALTCKIFPPKSVILDVLKNRNLEIVWENPRILHYCGDSKKELRRLLKKDKPDLLLNHSFPSFDLPVFQVYHPIKRPEDWVRNKDAKTNSLILAKTYYRSLGIQVRFQEVDFPSRKKRKKMALRLSFSRLWQAFERFMGWS